MARWTPEQLAARTKVPLDRICRAEASDGPALLSPQDADAITSAFASEGVRFLGDSGVGAERLGRAGGRLPDEGLRPDQLTSENDL
jgi:hypothetical protein